MGNSSKKPDETKYQRLPAPANRVAPRMQAYAPELMTLLLDQLDKAEIDMLDRFANKLFTALNSDASLTEFIGDEYSRFNPANKRLRLKVVLNSEARRGAFPLITGAWWAVYGPTARAKVCPFAVPVIDEERTPQASRSSVEASNSTLVFHPTAVARMQLYQHIPSFSVTFHQCEPSVVLPASITVRFRYCDHEPLGGVGQQSSIMCFLPEAVVRWMRRLVPRESPLPTEFVANVTCGELQGILRLFVQGNVSLKRHRKSASDEHGKGDGGDDDDEHNDGNSRRSGGGGGSKGQQPYHTISYGPTAMFQGLNLALDEADLLWVAFCRAVHYDDVALQTVALATQPDLASSATDIFFNTLSDSTEPDVWRCLTKLATKHIGRSLALSQPSGGEQQVPLQSPGLTLEEAKLAQERDRALADQSKKQQQLSEFQAQREVFRVVREELARRKQELATVSRTLSEKARDLEEQQIASARIASLKGDVQTAQTVALRAVQGEVDTQAEAQTRMVEAQRRIEAEARLMLDRAVEAAQAVTKEPRNDMRTHIVRQHANESSKMLDSSPTPTTTTVTVTLAEMKGLVEERDRALAEQTRQQAQLSKLQTQFDALLATQHMLQADKQRLESDKHQQASELGGLQRELNALRGTIAHMEQELTSASKALSEKEHDLMQQRRLAEERITALASEAGIAKRESDRSMKWAERAAAREAQAQMELYRAPAAEGLIKQFDRLHQAVSDGNRHLLENIREGNRQLREDIRGLHGGVGPPRESMRELGFSPESTASGAVVPAHAAVAYAAEVKSEVKSLSELQMALDDVAVGADVVNGFLGRLLNLCPHDPALEELAMSDPPKNVTHQKLVLKRWLNTCALPFDTVAQAWSGRVSVDTKQKSTIVTTIQGESAMASASTSGEPTGSIVRSLEELHKFLDEALGPDTVNGFLIRLLTHCPHDPTLKELVHNEPPKKLRLRKLLLRQWLNGSALPFDVVAQAWSGT